MVTRDDRGSIDPDWRAITNNRRFGWNHLLQGGCRTFRRVFLDGADNGVDQ